MAADTAKGTATQLHPDVESVVLSEEDIRGIVTRMGDEISRDYAGRNPLVVTVLRGAFIFTADLTRALTKEHVVDFIALSSYTGDKTTGNVRLLMDTRQNMENKHVLIVEDILDSGYTLDYLIRTFKTRKPLSVKTAVLLDKPDRHIVPVEIDYCGFTIPDVWVVGYGLDYNEKHRTLPYIAEMYPQK